MCVTVSRVLALSSALEGRWSKCSQHHMPPTTPEMVIQPWQGLTGLSSMCTLAILIYWDDLVTTQATAMERFIAYKS